MREHLQTAFLLIVALLLVVWVGKVLVNKVPDLIVTFMTPIVIPVLRAMGFRKLEEEAMALDLGICICGAFVVGFVMGRRGNEIIRTGIWPVTPQALLWVMGLDR